MQELDFTEGLVKSASREKWNTIGSHRRSGVLVPLFSVYSKKSFGIGDLGDLKLIIDWAEKTGNSIVQLLPMNETGPLFCPYDSITAFGLEPAYFSLSKSTEYQPVSPGQYVDYKAKERKISLLREVFDGDMQQGHEGFKVFQEDNGYWLQDFAMFKVLKEQHRQSPWHDWQEEFKYRDPQALKSFQAGHIKDIIFVMWLQWQLSEQFKDVKRYAASKGILLKGDLPILVSRDSADVWSHPEFFKLDLAAGAPPDMYCAKGQRWGMPTYNWVNIAKDNYRYLIEKLRYAENFYDILRIDHVVGLFRIWSIPYQEPCENHGLNGFFDPGEENSWAEHGRNLLRVMLRSADMLLCAEDLGVIPKICTDALQELGIPGNDVQRWTKDWKLKHDFLKPQEYRQLSAAMLSTHDTTNWPAWWENEAGSVDEGLFVKKCSDHRQINFSVIKDKLFDANLSRHGRLRWLKSIDSEDKLVAVLGRRKEELADFIDMYNNSFREKEKLWVGLGLGGPMREKSDKEIMAAALRMVLETGSIFCINTLFDWLYLTDVLKGDPFRYRINTPGTISPQNWSLVLPIPLEKLLSHKINRDIQKIIVSSGRK